MRFNSYFFAKKYKMSFCFNMELIPNICDLTNPNKCLGKRLLMSTLTFMLQQFVNSQRNLILKLRLFYKT